MLILFTSICKTGSGSFWWGIKHNFDARRFWVKNNIRAEHDLMSLGNLGIYEALQTGTKIKITTEEPQFIVVHFPHGLHKVLPVEKFEYITFLRHPMKRSISEIQYVLGGESLYRDKMDLCVFFDNQKWDYKKLNNKQLKAILEYCLEQRIGCNIMTKQFSGLEPLCNVFPKHKRPSGGVYPPGSSSLVKYDSSTMETFLEAAKKNLKDYKFIGFQERGKNDHKLCSKIFGLKYEDHGIRFHKTKPLKRLWQEQGNLLKKMNEYDLQLYKYALKLRKEMDNDKH